MRSMRRKTAIDELTGRTFEQLVEHIDADGKRLRSAQLMVDSTSLLNSFSVFTDTSGKLIRVPPQHTSCIHDLSYFVNVGADRVFAVDEESWANRAATQVVEGKSKAQPSAVAAEAKSGQP